MERLKYHFEPQTGWMNDPNGLIFYKGKYHAFFQHNPHEPVWGPMHWGHAVSEDLVYWQELPIALYPDMYYEDNGGCFSGSAIEKDGRIYLIYTSVSKQYGQSQSIAYSDDGINFTKYENNPVISKYPEDGSGDFRDPKVSFINGKYHMVCGSGKDEIGKVLLYTSADLFNWDYVGVLYEGAEHGTVLECPDFFELGDGFVLMFSQMGRKTHSTAFMYGDFDGVKFTVRDVFSNEIGPHIYAPQTFEDAQKRRILIGWLYSWDKKLDEGATYAGALTIPRELSIVDGHLKIEPVKEAENLLTPWDPMVSISGKEITINDKWDIPLRYRSENGISDVRILKDTKTIEIFINNGEAVFTYWFGK